MTQPRQQQGVHRDGEPVGGRWVPKTVPDTTSNDLRFNTDPVGEPNDWTERVVKIWGLQTVFTRTVNTDDDGNTVVSVATDCDDPSLVLLARKGDADYWSGDTWHKHRKDRRVWSADIACRMLEEGFVATGWGADSDAIRVAMSAASSPKDRIVRFVSGRRRFGPHTLTGVVAQIRGLALLQSMAPAQGWVTKLGGYDIPKNMRELLKKCSLDTLVMYNSLPKPPWDDTDPSGMPWGPQPVAGHANIHLDSGRACFVGEHGDLLWRALTETDYYGRSPLKETLREQYDTARSVKHMIVAAALYDDTAQQQLTTGLFDGGVHDRERCHLRNQALELFDYALSPANGECRWTDEQRDQISGFIAVVEGLVP